MPKWVRRLISSGINVGLILLLVAAVKFVPQIYPAFYTDFSRGVNHSLGTVSAFLPVPVWEILLALLVVWQVVSFFRSLFRKEFLNWLCRIPLILSVLALVFVVIWGLNFFGPGVSESVGLDVSIYTKSELQQATAYYARQASIWSTQVERDENGDVVLPSDEALSDAAVRSMQLLSQEYPRFSDPAPRVKFLLGSEAFGYMGTTGIYVCFTGESSVSRAAFATAIPFTMCHELGHSVCFCAEDEANFAGFLACTRSDDPLFRYSGYLNAFIYCYNSLYELDAAAAAKQWKNVTTEILHDCNAEVNHYAQYDGAVQEAAQSVNDAYLRSFEQEGTQSYNMVTDHLIAYYVQVNAIEREIVP